MFVRRQLLKMGGGSFLSLLATKVFGLPVVPLPEDPPVPTVDPLPGPPLPPPPPPASPEVYTPRISWEYVPTQVATIDDGMVTDIFLYHEVVLLRLHGMPTAGPHKQKLLYRITAINFSRYHACFQNPIQGCVHLEDAIRHIEQYKQSFPLTDAEAECLDRLICFISTSTGDQRVRYPTGELLPIPAKEFIVQYSGSPPEPTA